MGHTLKKLIQGYRLFSATYELQYKEIMDTLATNGQSPEVMVIGCADARVDPALMLHCDPGDLFIARNVANIVPPYAQDEAVHGASAALEFGICNLNVKHLIILGHSQCGGIHARLHPESVENTKFLKRWIDLIDIDGKAPDVDECAKQSLLKSYENCLDYPWIKERMDANTLKVHLWFFDIKDATIFAYDFDGKEYKPL